VISALVGTEDERPELASQTDGMVTLTWGDATIAYTLVPRPIPETQLAGPCATAWYWPQASDTLRDHQAHLLITLVDEGRDAIDKSIRLTQFAAAVAQVTSARAVLWAPAGLVHEPAAFIEQAAQTERDDLPLYLWIAFRLEPADEGGHRMFTTGLEAFDRSELEVDRTAGDPQRLLDDVYNVTHYHLTDSSPIKDADTVGLADGRQMRAQHQESLLGDGRQIVRLAYEIA
jgi:hypothetical protein